MIPYLFKKEKIPKKLPKEMEREISKIKLLKSKEKILKKSYEIITHKFKGRHFIALFYPKKIFTKNIFKIWNTKNFLICTHFNYILIIF